VWQREVADPAEYVTLWLHDAGHTIGQSDYQRRYDEWLDWFAANAVHGIGMGLVTLRRTDGPPQVRCEDVRQAVFGPAGREIADWLRRAQWLRAHIADDLLRQEFWLAGDVVRTNHDLARPDGWSTELTQLRLAGGMRWELEIDDGTAALVAAIATGATPEAASDLLAAAYGDDRRRLRVALVPLLRDLIERGFVLPVDLDAD
jgi:hypothetical protein